MKLLKLGKSYSTGDGTSLVVLQDFSTEIQPGTITALIGPSGCGKTTLLRLIGGLEKPDSGSVEFADSELGPISYLFQEPRLLPWDDVLTNVELVLRSSMVEKNRRLETAMHFLDMVGLADFARFKPTELSGGMRQRVAIARAFAYPAKTVLLDEPFQSLDAVMRFSLLKAYISLWEKDRRTTVYVTHDVPEALMIADTIARLSPRPASVADQMSIKIPQDERLPGDARLLEMQGRLYSGMSFYT